MFLPLETVLVNRVRKARMCAHHTKKEAWETLCQPSSLEEGWGNVSHASFWVSSVWLPFVRADSDFLKKDGLLRGKGLLLFKEEKRDYGVGSKEKHSKYIAFR